MFFNKSFKLKNIGFLFVLSTVQVGLAHETEKTFIDRISNFIGQSRVVKLFNKHVQTKIDGRKQQMLLYVDPEQIEPDQKYKILCKEAQDALAIAPEDQVPAKKLSPKSPFVQYAGVGAIAESNGIYINEVKCNERSYGTQRSLIFHEAAHVKYNDGAVDSLLELTSLFATAVATHKLINIIRPAGRYKLLHGLTVGISSLSLSSLLSAKFHRYFERRADIEGHHATQCAVCVQESADNRRKIFEKENHILRNNGYLWAAELEKIAAHLAQQNKLCSYHKEAQNQAQQS